MRGRVAPSSRKKAYQVLAKKQEDDIIKSELHSAGLRGKIHMRPSKVDLNYVSFDDEHINKERDHNVTLEKAKGFIRNAVFSKTVWDGRFERYYSHAGIVYLNNNNLQIRTSFKGDQIKGTSKRALEIIKNMEDNRYVFCPLVDEKIEDIDCIENREIADDNLDEKHLPVKYKQKEHWRNICKKCKWHDYY